MLYSDVVAEPTAGLNLIQTRDKVCNLSTKQENKHFVPNTSFYLKHTLQSKFKETENKRAEDISALFRFVIVKFCKLLRFKRLNALFTTLKTQGCIEHT